MSHCCTLKKKRNLIGFKYQAIETTLQTLFLLYLGVMVQYVVKCGGDIPNWKIVEIQGELELRDGTATGGFNGKYFGDSHFEEGGDPLLILGPGLFIFLKLYDDDLYRSPDKALSRPRLQLK